MSDKQLMSTDAFLILSAEINYQLSASRIDRRALLSLILGKARPPGDVAVLKEVVEVIQLGYGRRRRRLGPVAVIHPLRTAAILVRSMRRPTMLDFLGALMHDLEEDIHEQAVGAERWKAFSRAYNNVLGRFDDEQRWFLRERIGLLTRQDDQTYNQYLGIILDHARRMPDLLHVKVADRLDNTYDVSIARPGVTRYNFFRNVFDALFVPVFGGFDIEEYHFLRGRREGVQILSNLFKNIIFLSLLRKDRLWTLDPVTHRLSDALAVASLRVTQWVALEVFASCLPDPADQRKLLLECMEYCHGDGIRSIKQPDQNGDDTAGINDMLDGVFLDRYPMGDRKKRKEQLEKLYDNKKLLARLAVVFTAVFASFLNDPTYTIEGIDRHGVWATP